MELSKLENRLGYSFRTPELLRQALTHRSSAITHNERLEFLGDAGLGFVVADLLFHLHPTLREHELTIMRASLVNKSALARTARELSLGAFLSLGSGELHSGGHQRDSILADALEAIFGAVYEDGGFDALAQVIETCMTGSLERRTPENSKDPKTRLQEVLQARHVALPEYVVILHEGEEHASGFEVECRIVEPALVTRGKGSRRRDAEKQAAAAALTELENSHF